MELGGGGSWWVKSSFSDVQSSMFLWLIVHIAYIFFVCLFVFLYACLKLGPVIAACSYIFILCKYPYP